MVFRSSLNEKFSLLSRVSQLTFFFLMICFYLFFPLVEFYFYFLFLVGETFLFYTFFKIYLKHFKRLLFMYSYGKILAIFPVMYDPSLSLSYTQQFVLPLPYPCINVLFLVSSGCFGFTNPSLLGETEAVTFRPSLSLM